jgi:hypothetical protein
MSWIFPIGKAKKGRGRPTSAGWENLPDGAVDSDFIPA